MDLWREGIRANPQAVLDANDLIRTGDGYKLGDKHDGLTDPARWQNGDVLKKMNGRVVGDVERDRRLIDEVAAPGFARIKVRRDGRPS